MTFTTARKVAERNKPVELTANARRQLTEMILGGMSDDEIMAVPLRRNSGEDVPISRRHLQSIRHEFRNPGRMTDRQFECLMLGFMP